MATKKIELKGKARWARVFEENRDLKGYNDAAVPYEGFYTLDLILTKEEYQKLKDAGSDKKLMHDEETGERYVKLTRKHKDRFEWASGAPKTNWNYREDGGIPNGTEVTVVVSVYDTSKTSGTRLEEVEVISTPPSSTKEELEGEMPF